MMTLRGKWTTNDKAVDRRDLAAALALSRAHMKKRSLAEREARALDSHARRVGAAIRRAAREKEQRRMVWLSVRPHSESGRSLGRTRCRRLELMAGLLADQPSHRGADGLSSFHFSWRSRGLRPRKGQQRSHRYRHGEAVRLVRYIMRELAREIADGGIVSTISLDPDEIASVFGAIEELELAGGRDNASVYISIVISLPHELTAEARERILADVGRAFEEQGLPFAGVLHKPDPGTNQRNHHAHGIASLRPFRKEPDGSYSFGAQASSDLNDETWIKPLRQRIADAINVEMSRLATETGVEQRRFTHLSNEARGLSSRTKAEGKHGPGRKARDRKVGDAALAARERQLHLDRASVLDEAISLVTALSERVVPDVVALLATAREAVRARSGTAIRPEITADHGEKRRLVASVTEVPAPSAPATPRAPAKLPSASPTSITSVSISSQEANHAVLDLRLFRAIEHARRLTLAIFQPDPARGGRTRSPAGVRRLSDLALAGSSRRPAPVPMSGVPATDVGRSGAGHGSGDGVRGAGILDRDADRGAGEGLTVSGAWVGRLPPSDTEHPPAPADPQTADFGSALAQARQAARELAARKRFASEAPREDAIADVGKPKHPTSSSDPIAPNDERLATLAALTRMTYLPLRPIRSGGLERSANPGFELDLGKAAPDDVDTIRIALASQQHGEFQALFARSYKAMLARLRAALTVEAEKRPSGNVHTFFAGDRRFQAALWAAGSDAAVLQVREQVQTYWNEKEPVIVSEHGIAGMAVATGEAEARSDDHDLALLRHLGIGAGRGTGR